MCLPIFALQDLRLFVLDTFSVYLSSYFARCSFECGKVIFVLPQLRYTIGLKNSRVFLVRSEVKTEPIVTSPRPFSVTVFRAISFRLTVYEQVLFVLRSCLPRGRYFGNFWVGMCRWDPGTLSLY